MLIDVEHAALGAVSLPGSPLQFGAGGRDEHLAPPVLDQHGPAIRDWLARPAAGPDR
ncbi:MAG: hypothetical protein ACYCVZ_03780 [Streptosporangiaceae bacterium]